MTIPDAAAKPRKAQQPFRLPDPPQREPDEMTSYDQLHKNGNTRYLALHLGNPETTVVESDRWVIPHPNFGPAGYRRPDLLIAFGANPEVYKRDNGYIVSEQGKPPDFVMEIASESTAGTDIEQKPAYYAGLGIPEYWRFDETGNFHGARLAGDRLVDGQYRPIPIEELEDGVLQGYSEALNLYIRWDHGELGWHDPDTGLPISTLEDERARAEDERARAERAETAQFQAEARVRELEEEIRQLRGD